MSGYLSGSVSASLGLGVLHHHTHSSACGLLDASLCPHLVLTEYLFTCVNGLLSDEGTASFTHLACPNQPPARVLKIFSVDFELGVNQGAGRFPFGGQGVP